MMQNPQDTSHPLWKEKHAGKTTPCVWTEAMTQGVCYCIVVLRIITQPARNPHTVVTILTTSTIEKTIVKHQQNELDVPEIAGVQTATLVAT